MNAHQPHLQRSETTSLALRQLPSPATLTGVNGHRQVLPLPPLHGAPTARKTKAGTYRSGREGHCRNARSIAAFDFPRSERSIDCSHIVTRSLAITTQPTVVPMTTLAIPNPDTSCNHDASACPSLARFTLV